MCVCVFYQYPVNNFLVSQNGLEECCKAVAKRQIDGDELLVSELLYSYENSCLSIFRFSSVNPCLTGVNNHQVV